MMIASSLSFTSINCHKNGSQRNENLETQSIKQKVSFQVRSEDEYDANSYIEVCE